MVIIKNNNRDTEGIGSELDFFVLKCLNCVNMKAYNFEEPYRLTNHSLNTIITILQTNLTTNRSIWICTNEKK